MATDENTALIENTTNGSKFAKARIAFKEGDVEKSRNFHDGKCRNEEPHQDGGGLLKAIVFGGLDGILTSFAIVAGATGGNLDERVVLVLGFSNIFADALSMGVGEYLSSVAHNDWVLTERARESWEMENYPEGEIAEMIEIYVERGMSEDDATAVVTTMAQYKDFFVDVMMMEELHLQLPEKDHRMESFREGVVMFFAFASFGAMPLLGYVVIPVYFPHMSSDALFLSACIITGIVLFIMGSVKSYFSATNWLWAGTETLLLGGACGLVAHCMGDFINDFVSD